MQFLNKAKTLMLIAALFGFHSAFAETETSPDPTTVTKDVDVVGTSYTLAGTYNAGPGSKVYGDMSDKGVKVRTNKNENTTTFAVNEGYVITGITITGCANDTGKVDSAPIIVLSASVDGGENVLSEQISLPNNRTTTSPQSTVVAVTGIEAKSSITFTFDNSNVGKNYQWACTYTIEYKLAESSGGDEPIVEEITAALTNVSVELETVEGEADDILHFNFTVESNADTLYIAGLVEGYWAEVSYYCDSTESIMQGNLLPEGVNLEETPFLAVTPGEYSIAIPVAKTKDVLGLFTANRMANDSAAWGIALVTLADEYSYDSIYGQASGTVAISAYTAESEEPVDDTVYKTKKFYNFVGVNATRSGTELTLGSVEVDVNGTTCYKSTYDGYTGLVASKSWSFRENKLENTQGPTTFGIDNLKAGYRVTIWWNYSGAGGVAQVDNGVANQVEGGDITAALGGDNAKFVYKVVADGILAFTTGKWSTYWTSIDSILVEMPAYETTVYDFINWEFAEGETYLTVDGSQTRGTAYETGNNKNQTIFQCTNVGLDRFAFQAVYAGSNKGTWLRPSYGLTNYGATRSAAIQKMKAGDVVTFYPGNVTDFTGGGDGDGTWTVEHSDECDVITMTGDGQLGFCINKSAYVTMIKIVSEAMDVVAPVITVEGDDADVKMVTITCETEGAQLYYTIGEAEAVEYTAPFQISETAVITAYAVADGSESDKTSVEVVAGYIPTPTATITAVSGTSRTVTLACAVSDASIVYKTDSAAEYAAYAEPFSIAETTTVWAIASKQSAVIDTLTFASDALETTLAAGTEVAVAGVAYAKAAVADSATAEMYEAQGLTDLILTADQSSVLCTPTVTIEYAFYQTDPETDHIPAEPTLTGTIASGDTLKTLPYGKVEATAKADGYVATTTSIWLKAASDLTIVKTYDFSRAAWGGHTADLTVTIGSDAVATVNGTWLGTVTIADSLVEDFLVQTGTTWLKRSVSDGFYQFNSGGRMIGVNNVLRNQIVTIYGHAGNAALSLSLVDNGVAEADVMNTVEGSVYTYRITAPGVLALSMARYGYLDSITIAEDPAATKDVVIGINRAVGTSRFVEITCATEKSDIFYALGTETVNEIVTTTIDSTLVDTVVVVGDTLEPLLGYTYDTTTVTTYDTTIVYGEWQAYTEPVEFTTSGWIRGYATHLGDDSQPVEYYVEAGTTVQIVQPVITYTGNAEGGKTFEITVDESAVIGSVSLPIYYTLPGGEETLYEGPVTVANDVYGWLTAVSKLEGYDPSPLAYRYLDSRDSYTEKYEAVTAETTELPTEAADIEFADAPTINVSNPGAIKTSGRIYFHRTMHAGYNALVLPFAMTTANLESGAVKITDAAGNSLSGTDYTILRIQNSTDFTKADSLVAADALLHTANLVAAQTYLIKVADELVGQDIIFVSTEGNTIQHSAGNFSALAAEGAFKVVNNRTFAAVTADVQVYLLNDKGNVFVRQAAGATIPAYTPAIIADSAFTADNSQIKLFDRKYAAVYKSINSDSLFIPTQENVVAAYAEGWMCNADEANDWSSFVYVTNKKATIDPVTELELEKATVYPGVCIKNNVAKNVYFYVTNVANIKAFVLSNKTSEERTATCTATAADGETITATAASMDASAVIEMNLVGEKEYELKFEATGDMTIYAIKFKTAGLVGIEAVEIEREDDGVIYDMLGRRVQDVKAGQIYIMNGKKFMQR